MNILIFLSILVILLQIDYISTFIAHNNIFSYQQSVKSFLNNNCYDFTRYHEHRLLTSIYVVKKKEKFSTIEVDLAQDDDEDEDEDFFYNNDINEKDGKRNE